MYPKMTVEEALESSRAFKLHTSFALVYVLGKFTWTRLEDRTYRIQHITEDVDTMQALQLELNVIRVPEHRELVILAMQGMHSKRHLIHHERDRREERQEAYKRRRTTTGRMSYVPANRPQATFKRSSLIH